jgi:hypothetical protein
MFVVLKYHSISFCDLVQVLCAWIEKTAGNSTLINVGKEYNEGPCYRTTSRDCKGLIADSSCPHTTEGSATFIEKMKVDFRIMMAIAPAGGAMT